MKKIATLLFCGLLSLAIASSFEERKIFHYRTSAPPTSDWQLLGEPKRDELVTFSLALKQQNLDKLERFFWDNSDPHNPSFAHHMTREQVISLVAPPRYVVSKIYAWLKHTAEKVSGVQKIDDKGDVIIVKASVEYVEELFQTKLHKFEDVKKGKTTIKHLGELSVPGMKQRKLLGYEILLEIYVCELLETDEKRWF
jgi:subtilase family serine protease